MRYISLFSGIGGFEYAIQQYDPNAECVGYSEIYQPAIDEYTRHYPTHRNLGDVTKIRKKDIIALGQIDLLVGGFPCNDLSSAKTKNRNGLDGDKSGLFWTMLKIIKYIKHSNPNLKIIIENNASMAHKWRDMITFELSKTLKDKVHCNYFDSSQWIMQRRRRYYWTLNEIPPYTGPRLQTMKDVLIPIKEAKKYALQEKSFAYLNRSHPYMKNKTGIVIHKDKDGIFKISKVNYPTRWGMRYSTSSDSFIRVLTTSEKDSMFLDYRVRKGFIPRVFSKVELSRLFMYPDDYIKTNTRSKLYKLFGMTVCQSVIKYILSKV